VEAESLVGSGWDPELYEDDVAEQEVLEELRTVKERVEYILRKYPEARNSDFYLIVLYIRKFEKKLSKYIKYIPYEVIRGYDGLFESIRRARQYIQNTEGKYLPTDPEVLKKRRIKEQAIRKVVNRL